MLKRQSPYENMCQGKKAYKNPKIAERALKLINSTRGNEQRINDWMHVYHCDYCGKYHLGHYAG